MTDGAPILIPCEGSGCGYHFYDEASITGMCQMCGARVPVAVNPEGESVTCDHQRDDILARLDRGDFDG